MQHHIHRLTTAACALLVAALTSARAHQQDGSSVHDPVRAGIRVAPKPPVFRATESPAAIARHMQRYHQVAFSTLTTDVSGDDWRRLVQVVAGYAGGHRVSAGDTAVAVALATRCSDAVVTVHKEGGSWRLSADRALALGENARSRLVVRSSVSTADWRRLRFVLTAGTGQPALAAVELAACRGAPAWWFVDLRPAAAVAAAGLRLTVTDAAGTTSTLTVPTERVRAATVRLQLVDGDNAAPLAAARIRLAPRDRGPVWTPSGDGWRSAALRALSDGQRRRSADDGACFVYLEHSQQTLQLLPGHYRVDVRAGPEREAVTRELTVAAGDARKLRIAVGRWIDLAALGWYSADLHVHVKREAGDDPGLFAWMAAEDLHVMTPLYMTGYGTKANLQAAYSPAGDARQGRRLLSSGDEYRTTFSHVSVVGATASATAQFQGSYAAFGGRPPVMQPDFPPLAVVADWARAHGGAMIYAHGAGRPAMVVDAVSGRSRLFELLQWADYHGLARWYDLLSAGFRVFAVAGTDAPDFNTAGCDRVYAQVAGDLTFARFLAALEAGRSFVTTGPALLATVDDHLPGAEIQVAADGDDGVVVRVTCRVAAATPLDAVELVMNGEVLRRFEPPGGATDWELSEDVTLATSAWLAFRTVGGTGPVAPRAHTNPHFVVVDQQPIRDLAARRRLHDRVALGLQSLERRRFVQDQPATQREAILAWYREALATLAADR
jgi:hypothetical protein